MDRADCGSFITSLVRFIVVLFDVLECGLSFGSPNPLCSVLTRERICIYRFTNQT